MNEPNHKVARRRLFLALYPSVDERTQLLRAINKQAPTLLSDQARPVPLENLHITLVFFGGVTRSVQHCIEQVSSAIECPSISMTINRLGYWPRKRMLWAIPEPNRVPDALIHLVNALYKGLAACDVTLERREYRPHVTLARRLSHAPRDGHFPALEWHFSQFVLMESLSTPQGVRYPVIRAWSLTDSS
jgi:2'-5' RNA ligase